MDAKEFFDYCNTQVEKPAAMQSSMMTMFEDVEDINEVSTISNTSSSSDNFDDLDADLLRDELDDDLNDVSIAHNNDANNLNADLDDDLLRDDFDDFDTPNNSNVSEYSDADSNNSSSHETLEFSKPHSIIKSVTITPMKIERKESILNEIRDFLEAHRFNSKSSDSKLFNDWNSAYNDNVEDNQTMILKYFRIHYCIWFDDFASAEAACNVSSDFYKSIKMQYRPCTLHDVQTLSKVYREPWFNWDAINRYSIEPSFNALLIDLMSSGRLNMSHLERYANSTENLLNYIRLVLADKFVLSAFDEAVSSKTVELYATDILNRDFDRFAKIRHRADFSDLFALITTTENCGKVIRQEIVDRFADAFYLDLILQAESEGRLNVEFAERYLMNDLGPQAYIAKIYGDGSVDLALDPDSFTRAKILTDAKRLQLPLDNFTPEYIKAYVCLISSRYTELLPMLDYRKFLAICSFSQGKDILCILSKCTQHIKSFNAFWFQYFLLQHNLHLNTVINENINDNIVYVDAGGERVRIYAQSICDIIFSTAEFKNLVNDIAYVDLLDDNLGIVVSDAPITSPVKIDDIMRLDGSLTTWAKGKVDPVVLNQFAQYNSIIHANFLLAMQSADAKFKEEYTSSGLEINKKDYHLSSDVIRILEMNLAMYSLFDKMFMFVNNNPAFYGLFKSKYLFDIFSKLRFTCKTGALPSVVLTLLYSILKVTAPDKLITKKIVLSDLDPAKSVIFITGLTANTACVHYKVLFDSIDSTITDASRSNHVILTIENGAIALRFM